MLSVIVKCCYLGTVVIEMDDDLREDEQREVSLGNSQNAAHEDDDDDDDDDDISNKSKQPADL